jgi:4,5-dihydroxyphthalate decarboxylase
MQEESLRIAIDLYDRHLPLFYEGRQPEGVPRLKFLEVGMVPPRRHGVQRHRRMLVEREFDGAEVSLASYLVAREQGMSDMIALPIFPRRLFSQNHIFVSDKANIQSPADLVGKRVAIWAFQVTMSVLAKGDLKRDYGVDWRDIKWVAQNKEEIEKDYGGGLHLERAPDGFDPYAALRDGTVDAYINPHPPEAIMMPGNGISRLFPRWEETTRDYFKNHGYFPIMHVLALKTPLLERYPTLAAELCNLFDTARATARDYYIDANFSMIMHSRNTLEREIQDYASDTWQSGLEPNRKNLEDFIGYCVDQHVLDRPTAVDDAFLAV